MAKKASKRRWKAKPAAAPASDTQERLTAARTEIRRLRELKALQRTITRALMAEESSRLDLARTLCAGTAYGVYDSEQYGRYQFELAEAIRVKDELTAELAKHDTEVAGASGR
jgi:hypothetical protein